MPELPEVESIKIQLEKYLVGHVIKKVEIRYHKCFQGDLKNVENAKVIGIRRFAKVQVIDLSNEHSLIIHVKMTGQIIYRGPNLKSIRNISDKVKGGLGGKHNHVIFHLDKKGKLYYIDYRKFGWIKVVKNSEVSVDNFIGKLGPEPLVNTRGKPLNVLTPEKFSEILSKSGRSIKVLLMDQTKIGGVGNIYANDALWLAKINPKTPAKKLSNKDTKLLFEAIHTVLKAGLKYGGASELAFVTPDGAEGEYQKHSLAYGMQGKLCPRCKKGKFEKFFLGGRGTYICPICQR